MIKSNRKVIIDTETTGLDYLISDKVIEIGAIEVYDDCVIGERYFHKRINPRRKISSESTSIHGITEEDLIDSPEFKDVYDEFISFIGSDLIIAHNAEFDRRMINLELQLIGKPTIEKHQVLDSLALAKMLFKGKKVSLDSLCSMLNIDNSERVKHGALIDVKLLGKVYIEIMKLVNSDQNLQLYVNNYLNFNKKNISFRCKTASTIKVITSDIEEQEHKNFLTKHIC